MQLKQRRTYELESAVNDTYRFNSLRRYLDTGSIYEANLERANKNFYLAVESQSFDSQVAGKFYEVEVKLYRALSRIRRTPTISDVIRNAWPVYLGLFIPICICLRFVMKESFQYQLFQTSTSIKIGETEIHRVF